jgi:hypothetical protein
MYCIICISVRRDEIIVSSLCFKHVAIVCKYPGNPLGDRGSEFEDEIEAANLSRLVEIDGARTIGQIIFKVPHLVNLTGPSFKLFEIHMTYVFLNPDLVLGRTPSEELIFSVGG